MSQLDTFSSYRNLLFSVAYRMLGSIMEAEEVVQESFLRWQSVDEEEVRNPKGFLTSTVTRLCIDRLRSARAQREEYVGPWLPEMLVEDHIPDVSHEVALAESLSTAFLLLLETLNPVERAVFLLHDIFGYDFRSISDFVGKSESNCRQIARRARNHIDARRPRFDPSETRQVELVEQFMDSCTTGNLVGLMELLAEDVMLYSDGGGVVQAARRPLHGASNVGRFLLGIIRKAPPGVEVRQAVVNGQPGIIAYLNGQPFSIFSFKIEEEQIHTIYLLVNPHKLQSLPPL